MDKEIRQLIIDFMTKSQNIDYGKNSTATFKTWKNFYVNFINNLKGYEAYWNTVDESISVFFEHVDVMTIRFNESKTQFWLESDHWNTEEPELKLLLGRTVMQMLNATAQWETEQLQKYEIYEEKEKISIFLSLTSVTLTPEEKETVQDILKRMAESEGYNYEKMQNVSFEIELRAQVGESTKLKNNAETKDLNLDEEEPSFEWL